MSTWCIRKYMGKSKILKYAGKQMDRLQVIQFQGYGETANLTRTWPVTVKSHVQVTCNQNTNGRK